MAKARASRGVVRTKPPRTGDRVPLGLRITPSVRSDLEKAARRNGRSLSQETEFRLERSLERQELFVEVLELKYGRQVAGLVGVVGEAIDYALENAAILGAQKKLQPSDHSIDLRNGDQRWLKDPFVFSEILKTVHAVLMLFQPPGDPSSSPIAEAIASSDAWTRDIPKSVCTLVEVALRGRVTGHNDVSTWADKIVPLLRDLPGPAQRN